jgi:signal transduction histidine kinase
LTREVVEELAPLANEKGLTVSFEQLDQGDGQAAETIMGDRLELRRVITNLLGNAIKFTDSGSVSIRLSAYNPAKTSSPSWSSRTITLEVEDTGPGIPAQDQPTLFESFVQGNHRRGGSGLGLHLSRRIVEAHSGKIEVKSEIGKGSLFIVWLPTQIQS